MTIRKKKFTERVNGTAYYFIDGDIKPGEEKPTKGIAVGSVLRETNAAEETMTVYKFNGAGWTRVAVTSPDSFPNAGGEEF